LNGSEEKRFESNKGVAKQATRRGTLNRNVKGWAPQGREQKVGSTRFLKKKLFRHGSAKNREWSPEAPELYTKKKQTGGRTAG